MGDRTRLKLGVATGVCLSIGVYLSIGAFAPAPTQRQDRSKDQKEEQHT